MAHFFSATLATTALAGIAVLANAPEHEPIRAPEFQAEALIEDSKTWVFKNRQNDASCLVTKTRQISRATSLIEFEPKCASVYPETDSVKVWQADGDGVIRLADEAGNTLKEFRRNGTDFTFSSDRLRLAPRS
ncbi:hypothetical protein ACFQ14_02745 [Pseudahrensia aquimaris]|uniref:Alkaline proteinase inhibitor/ Outer membrane lipoprotein Omp19 domain-containing protein n=1 Tax=Pseudahrensia aquimaris TaxID=744461 RepID=A0ABW3FA75_9HYPH